jgi:hypothetical protein
MIERVEHLFVSCCSERHVYYVWGSPVLSLCNKRYTAGRKSVVQERLVHVVAAAYHLSCWRNNNRRHMSVSQFTAIKKFRWKLESSCSNLPRKVPWIFVCTLLGLADHEGSRIHRNVSNRLPLDTASHVRWRECSAKRCDYFQICRTQMGGLAVLCTGNSYRAKQLRHVWSDCTCMSMETETSTRVLTAAVKIIAWCIA